MTENDFWFRKFNNRYPFEVLAILDTKEWKDFTPNRTINKGSYLGKTDTPHQYPPPPTLEQITAEAKKRYAHWPQKQVEFTEGAMFAINKES